MTVRSMSLENLGAGKNVGTDATFVIHDFPACRLLKKSASGSR